MKPINRFLIIGALGVILFFVLKPLFKKEPFVGGGRVRTEILKNTWAGYKKFFITPEGRVARPKEGDSVSEGQAYAMLRAVWMGDQDTFDRCYRWTEKNLSRKEQKGDHLLAWRWGSGRVIDWMPASDADVDYALSLVLADSKWGTSAPLDLEDYRRKARFILLDILKLETFRTSSGRLYLAPWALPDAEKLSHFPINPSYYSPAHFRLFYLFTEDQKWLELAATTYFILNSLSREFDGKRGEGLIPDWCRIDREDRFSILEGKNPGFGWDAVRVPIRVAMDYYWFKSREAKELLRAGFAKFVDKELAKTGKVFCEYNYGGEPQKSYENPLFYTAYFCALSVAGSRHASDLLAQARNSIVRNDSAWFYLGQDEYYVNSLSWFSEAFDSSIMTPPSGDFFYGRSGKNY